jgi:hypothetical protein
MGEIGALPRINGRRRRRLRARAFTGAAVPHGIRASAAAPSDSARRALRLMLNPRASNSFGPLMRVEPTLRIVAGAAALTILVILATWAASQA